MKRMLMLAVVATPVLAWADPPTPMKPIDNLDQPTLTGREVGTYSTIYQSAVRACYDQHARKARAATGELTLRLTVHRNGAVYRFAVDAPGVTGLARRQLETCLRDEVAGWHFPVRRGFTDAVIPYLFLRTATPGAGPLPSCWNARGCREPKRAKPVAV